MKKSRFSDETRRKMSLARIGRFGGDKHPNWKGGRITSKRDGYILVLAPENHPYAKFC